MMANASATAIAARCFIGLLGRVKLRIRYTYAAQHGSPACVATNSGKEKPEYREPNPSSTTTTAGAK